MAAAGDFAGSIPELYDRCMVPMLFAPYADHIGARIVAARPHDILETAAGTGVMTRLLARELPDTRIVTTDISPAMLDVAARGIASPNVGFQAADAQSLPFEDRSFDWVLCQFGAMFFPDRVGAYREARRVLRPGGRFLFSVWNRIEDNPVPAAISDALARLFPARPPEFFRRGPHGYHDIAVVRADLAIAGFADVGVETVEMRCRPRSANEAAIGFCHGSPVRAEIEAQGPGALDRATGAVAAVIASFAGADGVDAPMSAHIFTARRG